MSDSKCMSEASSLTSPLAGMLKTNPTSADAGDTRTASRAAAPRSGTASQRLGTRRRAGMDRRAAAWSRSSAIRQGSGDWLCGADWRGDLHGDRLQGADRADQRPLGRLGDRMFLADRQVRVDSDLRLAPEPVSDPAHPKRVHLTDPGRAAQHSLRLLDHVGVDRVDQPPVDVVRSRLEDEQSHRSPGPRVARATTAAGGVSAFISATSRRDRREW